MLIHKTVLKIQRLNPWKFMLIFVVFRRFKTTLELIVPKRYSYYVRTMLVRYFLPFSLAKLFLITPLKGNIGHLLQYLYLLLYLILRLLLITIYILLQLLFLFLTNCWNKISGVTMWRHEIAILFLWHQHGTCMTYVPWKNPCLSLRKLINVP